MKLIIINLSNFDYCFTIFCFTWKRQRQGIFTLFLLSTRSIGLKSWWDINFCFGKHQDIGVIL